MRPSRSSRARVIALAGLATLLLGLSPIAVPAPASATVTGSTSSADVRLYNQCQTHVVHYTISVSPDTTFWRLEIQTVDPTGLRSEGTVFTSNDSATTGTATTLFCGSETPGTWTVHAEGIMQSGAPLPVPVSAPTSTAYALPDSFFTVQRAETRTTLTKQRLRHHRIRLITTVTDQRPDGFGPTDGAPVELQRLIDGNWHKVRDSRRPTSRGRTAKIVRVSRSATFRAVTSGNGYFDGSTSRPLTIRSGPS